MLVTWSKSHVVLTMETSHCKFSSSLLSLVSNDLIWQPHLGVKQFYGWKLLAICHHTEKPCDHRYCNSGDKIFFICHMTSPKHMFKQLCEFMGRSPPWWFTTLPCLVAIGLIEVESVESVYYATWPQKITWLRYQVYLWVVVLHGMSPPCQVLWP